MTAAEIRSKLMWVIVGVAGAVVLFFGLRKKPEEVKKVTRTKVTAAVEEEKAKAVKVQEVPAEDEEMLKAARKAGIIR